MSKELHNVGALLACIADDRTRAVYSAAPELLAALKAFESYMSRHLVIGKNGKANREVSALIESARNTIAKVEGER